MKLIHRSARARDPVRSVSSGGEVFIGAVVMIMLIAVLGDIVGPVMLGEFGMEFALFDMGGEGAIVAFQHWSLLEMLALAASIALGLSVIRNELMALARSLVSILSRGLGKIPI